MNVIEQVEITMERFRLVAERAEASSKELEAKLAWQDAYIAELKTKLEMAKQELIRVASAAYGAANNAARANYEARANYDIFPDNGTYNKAVAVAYNVYHTEITRINKEYPL